MHVFPAVCSPLTSDDPRAGGVQPLHWRAAAPAHRPPCWDCFSCTRHFLRCFTPCFQLKLLSLNPPKPLLGNAIFFCSVVYLFSRNICKAEGPGEVIFASLHCKQYAGSQNVLNIWMKKLLLLSNASVFSLILPICNVKSSISLWKVLNLFLPFTLVLHRIIFRSRLSTVNYFFVLPAQVDHCQPIY